MIPQEESYEAELLVIRLSCRHWLTKVPRGSVVWAWAAIKGWRILYDPGGWGNDAYLGTILYNGDWKDEER